MPRQKKQVANIDDRSCYVRLLLYADNEQHMNLYDRILHDTGLFDARTEWGYIGIAHTLYDDEGNEILEGEGKKHYHIYLKFRYPMWIKSLCRRFGFLTDLGEPDDKFIRCITGRFENALVYLTHLNAPDKEQYQYSDLFGTGDLLELYRVAALNYSTKKIDKRAALSDVLSWVSQQDDIITASQMLRFLLDSPYFSVRNEYWLREIWLAHNQKIYDLRRQSLVKSYADGCNYIEMRKAVNADFCEITDDELLEMGFNDDY